MNQETKKCQSTYDGEALNVADIVEASEPQTNQIRLAAGLRNAVTYVCLPMVGESNVHCYSVQLRTQWGVEEECTSVIEHGPPLDATHPSVSTRRLPEAQVMWIHSPPPKQLLSHPEMK
jgi:hypothetical protein